MKKYKKYFARPCGCSYKACPDWHVSPVAAVQGVNFTEKQAKAVAKLLNDRGERKLDKESKW